jgi:hypothetical protein
VGLWNVRSFEKLETENPNEESWILMEEVRPAEIHELMITSLSLMEEVRAAAEIHELMITSLSLMEEVRAAAEIHELMITSQS